MTITPRDVYMLSLVAALAFAWHRVRRTRQLVFYFDRQFEPEVDMRAFSRLVGRTESDLEILTDCIKNDDRTIALPFVFKDDDRTMTS